MKKAYIATAIPYLNGQPHLGHAMDYLLADVYRRYLTGKGVEVRLQAGTDEHGNKVFKKALDAGVETQEFVDRNAELFREFIHRLGVDYTDFVRTTDPDHMRRCQDIWVKLDKYIYKSSYEGWYCEGCEGFVTQTEYDETSGICPDHAKPYQKLSEDNYYLRIADFKEKIISVIKSGELRILPESRKKEFLNLLEDMPDVSISRPAKQLSWGVPVPGDDTQTMYVWLDALTNYITVLGYPDNDISDWWPAELQVVGKDILRFHIGIWPTILLGLGLPLPKTILSHGHITVDGSKMSKSIGNVVDPIEVLDRHGLDPFRYFFLRHVPTTDDADFGWEKYDAAYADELANDLGNLVQRLAVMCQKYNISGQALPDVLDAEYAALMDNFEFSTAFDYVWGKVQAINKLIDDTKPWMLAKDGATEQLESTMSTLVRDLLVVSVLLDPFLPTTSAAIKQIFTAEQVVPPATPLFPK